MGVPELYHVGIVVPDITAAQARFTELVGTQWGPITEPTMEWRDGDGTVQVTQLRVSFSSGPPHIELIEERPGTVWVCNEHSNLHHIGFYSGVLAADSQHLTDAGCPLQGTMATASEASAFAYHRDPLGIRLELVDESSRSFLADLTGDRET
jgi:catechol 2,3-dioxygenase-like lactoylglutathione lyase family enzyme